MVGCWPLGKLTGLGLGIGGEVEVCVCVAGGALEGGGLQRRVCVGRKRQAAPANSTCC